MAEGQPVATAQCNPRDALWCGNTTESQAQRQQAALAQATSHDASWYQPHEDELEIVNKAMRALSAPMAPTAEQNGATSKGSGQRIEAPASNGLGGLDGQDWHQVEGSWDQLLSPDHDQGANWTYLISRSKSPHLDRHTVSITNLPADVSHKEITSIVRGGRLVEVWIRRVDRIAAVTFETAVSASNFIAFGKNMTLTLRGHKVEIGWSGRQFDINPQLRGKLSKGHSRNLVIRGAAQVLTEQKIRHDMDHIHNLVIIAVVVQPQDVFISTNSISAAQFAQTCMRSRREYKPFRIEWYPDECNEPLPPFQTAKTDPVKVDKSKTNPALTNRFDLLDLSDALEPELEEDSSDLSDGIAQPRSNATDS
ncbi:MAG: hypothetical protein Q9162_006752 [Coniocarpon cinnabarinum]